MRTLIFNFDGTMNGRDDEHSTNVLKLHRGYSTSHQISFYFEGPGNDDNILTKFLGGAFGIGSLDIRDDAMRTLRSVYRATDRIAAVGFSRGAGVARLFCNEIAKEGVNGEHPSVCFLGCFDTVGAYLPIGPSQQNGLFKDLHVSPAVEVAAHAVALHEDRDAFTPNLMNKREGINEVWFRGVHSDVGGGFAQTGLSDTAMGWMIEQMEDRGITVAAHLEPDPFAPIGVNGGFYRRGSRRVGVKMDDEWSDLEPAYYTGEENV